jgi:DNA-binding GntR family transcriptional regulator
LITFDVNSASEDGIRVNKGVQGIRPPMRRGLTEQVADSIRQAIFSGSFELGDRLNEADIADRLNVSRGPVREALAQLKQEGIVTMSWHRGAYIMELSAVDVSELYSLRTVLEVFAIRQAARVAAPADLEAMKAVLAAMSKSGDDDDQSDFDMIQLDIRFHDELYQAAHHDRLSTAWSSIRSQVMFSLLVKRHTSNEYYRDLVIAEHQQLFDLVSSRDADACEAAIREHISATYDRLAASFRDAGELPATGARGIGS